MPRRTAREMPGRSDAARNDFCAWRLRLRSRDQSGRAADLSERRLRVRQRRPAAALFNLETPAFATAASPIRRSTFWSGASPRSKAASARCAVASGQAALAYAFLTLADRGGSIVAPPQLYGTTHTLLAHTLQTQRHRGPFRRQRPRRGHRGADRRDDPRDLLRKRRQSRGQRLRHRGARRRRSPPRRAAHRRQHGRDADPAAADRARRRHRRAFADQVHGRPRRRDGRRDRRLPARFDWRAQAKRFPMFCEPDDSYHGLVYVDRFGARRLSRPRPRVYQRTTGAVLAPMSAFLLLQGIETVALRMERHVDNARAVAEFLRADPRVAWVDYAGFRRQPLSRSGAKISRRPRALAAHLRRRRRPRGGQGVL